MTKCIIVVFLLFELNSFCFCQNFLSSNLDTAHYFMDTVYQRESIEITYKKMTSPVVLKISYRTTDNNIDSSYCFYFDGYETEITAQYINGLMSGKWIEYNKRDSSKRIVDYNVATTCKDEGQLLLYSDTLSNKRYCVPEPKGGLLELRKIIEQNMFLPPSYRFFGKEKQIVYCHFIVLEDFNVVNIEIDDSIDLDLIQESKRLIGLSKWTRGCSRGKPISTKFIIPFSFELSTVKQ